MNISDRDYLVKRRPWLMDAAAASPWIGLIMILALSYVGLSSPSAVAAEEWHPLAVATLDGMKNIAVSASGDEVIVLGSDAHYRLAPSTRCTASLERLPPRSSEPTSGIIPRATAAFGNSDIRAVLFVATTTRYQYGVLGDVIEVGTLAVEQVDRNRVLFELDEGSVFEDLTPRLYDIDADKNDEVVVVRFYLHSGAALSIFGLRDGALIQIAEEKPIGRPFRWLNPLSAADFDEDI
jgi:hypothetical protein